MIIFFNLSSYAKYSIESKIDMLSIKKADDEKPFINGRNYDVDYEKFNTDVTINYNDNIGIKYARYWFNPENKVFEETGGREFINNLTFQMNGWYKIEASDLYDNKTVYCFIIDKSFDKIEYFCTRN